MDLIKRYLFFFASNSNETSGFWRKVEKRANGATGGLPGVQLKHLSR
jgi:hypothetical protein